jgi:proline iminopeptidase
MNQSGISEKTLQTIITTCLGFPTVKRVILYGSRARGDYKHGSDIDIAIDAPEMSDKEFSRLWNSLDDLPIIYTMDIVHLQALKNQPLLDAIRQDGRVISP